MTGQKLVKMYNSRRPSNSNSFVAQSETASVNFQRKTPTKIYSKFGSPASSQKSYRSHQSEKVARFAWRDEEDQEIAENMFNAQIAYEKSRNILYSPYVTKGYKSPPSSSISSPKSIHGNESFFSSSQISSFNSHVTRIRTTPRRDERETGPIPSPKEILIPKPPNLEPTRKEREALLKEIDIVLAEIESK